MIELITNNSAEAKIFWFIFTAICAGWAGAFISDSNYIEKAGFFITSFIGAFYGGYNWGTYFTFREYEFVSSLFGSFLGSLVIVMVFFAFLTLFKTKKDNKKNLPFN